MCDPAGAWVFLWVTSSGLIRALKVAAAWKLWYSGRAFVWIKTQRGDGDATPMWVYPPKVHMGMGFTTRKNAEDVLLFKVGKPQRLSKSVREIIFTGPREHSRKPTEAFARIEEFCPGPRLELFAREPRPGWASWGAETQKFAAIPGGRGMNRTLVWWSTGAASAVAAKLVLAERPDALIVRCETGNEDPDNYRFEADVSRWLGKEITILRSVEYADVWDVFQKRRYMSGVAGAPCTSEMKVRPRIEFQRPGDIHVFGYTADSKDIARFNKLRETYFELAVRAPLIERGVTKAATLAMIESAGLRLPRSYQLGFPNANCLGTGCVKATSPDYWALYRRQFPDRFARTANYSREIGCRLARLNGERVFIDQIPADHAVTDPIVPACDFLCHIAEHEMGGPA